MKNLILISLLCMCSCRTLQKSKSSADSSAVRSSNSNEKFTREIIREYLPDTGTPQQPGAPQVITVDRPYPVLMRERILESGERQQASTEEKRVEVSEKTVEKQPLPWWVYVSIGVGGMIVLLVIVALIYLILKVRSLKP